MPGEEDHGAANRYAKWVVDEMRVKGWNQARLAAATGMSPSLIASIRHGTALRPSPEHIGRIAEVFGTDPNHIFHVAGWWHGELQAEELSSLERAAISTLRGLSVDKQQIALKLLRALTEEDS